MIPFLWCALLLSLLLLLGLGFLWLGFKFLAIFERFVDSYGKRVEIPSGVLGPVAGQFSQVGKTSQEIKHRDIEVPEVDPEAILKRAPKPTGFGHTGDGNR